MPTRGSKDPNGRALRGRRAHTTFALLTDPARQIWNSFNNRANAGGADAPEAAVNGCLYDRFKSLYNKTATKPSLVIVPARFKSGTLYSQIPSSNADFTVTRPLNTATRFDSSALIQTGITSGVPRLDYYTSGGVTGCPALLVEPSGTNVLSYSEEFDNAAWNKSAMTVSTGTTAAFTAPDGSTNADKIIATTASGTHNINRSGLTSAAYTFSVFAKAGEESVISLWLRGASVRAEFNLVSGTVSNITTTSARIENYGNGWYRCTVYDSTTGTTAHVYGRGGAAYTGNGVDGFYLWGAQLETGSVATSYIPTTTGTVTRNADVISVSGAVSGSIGQTEGTIYVEVDFRNLGYNGVIATIQTNDWVADSIQIQKSLGNQWRFTIRAASSGIINTDLGTITAGIYRVALAYNTATSGTVLAVNGSILSTLTASSIPACNSLVLGARNQNGTFGIQLNDRIRAAALYTTRLTNAELQSLTNL